MADVESLALQVTGDVQSAETSINSLITTLDKLKKATAGGCGLDALDKSLQKLSIGSSAKLTSLAKALSSLSKVSNVKLSSSIANQISAIGNAISSQSAVDYSKINEIATALKPLETLGKSNLGSIVNQLKKLPEAANALNALDLTSFKTRIREVADAIRPLADEMEKVAKGFSAFPAKIQKFLGEQAKVPAANEKTAFSFAKLATKISAAVLSLKKIGTTVATWINKSSEYVENLNLFTVSMGEYAESAKAYAEQVGDLLGIDPSAWLRNQGVFMTLGTGFGVAADRAATMSQQLTQLGYDISSFFNISVEDAMQKLQSGLSGELEPLRRLGYDLSQAKLEAVALSLGIDKTVSSMTQAEKAELRYYAIMTQVTTAHGDMARTLNDPANQMRIFKAQLEQTARALGNIFIPALNAVMPYAIALVKVIRILADSIASLFGYKLPEMDWSEGVTSGATDASDAIDEATESAKKMKRMLLGIDELNVLSDNSSSDTDSGSGGFDFELPTYDFIGDATDNRVNAIVESMKEWLGITGKIDSWADFFDTKLGKVLATVGLIGSAFAVWKVSKTITDVLATIQKFSSTGFTLSLGIIGVASLIADLDKLADYFEDYSDYGADFENVSGMISSAAGVIGDALLIMGNWKLAAALKGVQGLGEIVSSINSIAENGVDETNALNVISGLSNIAFAVGLFTKNIELMGLGISVQGLTTIVQEILENVDAIRNGDWSGVDKVVLVTGAIEALGGIVVGMGWLNNLKKANDIGKAADSVGDITEVTGKVSTKLTSLAKNLALGIVIIAEVAAAAALFAGAIWLLGVELEQVGIAWDPVIENGENIGIAIGLGTGILVGIGLVTAGLGTAGTALIVNIALGVAVLGEIGVAAALFLAEILIVGKLLDEIYQAWEPVIDNGETVATAIGVGTGILVGVGVVAAALGAAAVASVGLLPLAIAVGTAMLLELGIATGAFLTEITKVGDQLVDIGEAWQPVLDNGETIATAITVGTGLLIGVGAAAAAMGAATVLSFGLLPVAIDIGTEMLVQLSESFGEFCGCISEVANDITGTLAPALNGANDTLPDVTEKLGLFVGHMTILAGEMVVYAASSTLAGIAMTVKNFIDLFTDDPIRSLADEMSDQYDNMLELKNTLYDIIPVIEDVTDKMGEYDSVMAEYNKATGNSGGVGGVVGTIVKIGVQVINDAATWWSNVKSWWGQKVGSVQSFTTNVVNSAKTWWSNVTSWWNTESSGGISAKIKAIKGDGWTSVQDWIGDLTATLGIKLPKIRVKWSDIEVLGATISYPSGFETYAMGGFPAMGQMFIAREAGPELVGTIGSRTAVANNDQIVESVSRGVYQAVVSAMGQSAGAQVVEARVNDKVLFEVVVDRNRQETMRTGYNPLLGGV